MLVDEFGVNPNTGRGIIHPMLLAQLHKKWEVVKLLTEQYGCTMDVSLLSYRVC